MSGPYREASTRSELGERRCLYCAALLESESTCSRCGVEARGRETSDASLDLHGRMCPRCKTSQLASSMVQPADIVVHECAACHGVLIPPNAWTVLFDRVSAGEPVDVGRFVPLKPGAPGPVLLTLLACPGCGAEMDRGVFGARSSVSIDVCGSHGVWLDAAELAPILAHFRRLESGDANDPDDPDAPVDAEEMALLVQIRNAESKMTGGGSNQSDNETWADIRREMSGVRASFDLGMLRARLDEVRLQKRLRRTPRE